MFLPFFFLNLAILSAGVILILVVRAWPRLDDAVTPKGAWERWLTSNLPERFDRFFHSFFLRTLRKVRVFALKVDNAVDAKLKRMKLESGEGIKGPKPDLSSLTEEKKTEE